MYSKQETAHKSTSTVKRIKTNQHILSNGILGLARSFPIQEGYGQISQHETRTLIHLRFREEKMLVNIKENVTPSGSIDTMKHEIN